VHYVPNDKVNASIHICIRIRIRRILKVKIQMRILTSPLHHYK